MAQVEIPAQRTHAPRNLWYQGEYAYTEAHGRVRVGRVDYDWVKAFQVDANGDRISQREIKVDKVELKEDEPGKIKPLWAYQEGKPVEIYVSKDALPLLRAEDGAPACLNDTPDHPNRYTHSVIVSASYRDLKWMSSKVDALLRRHEGTNEEYALRATRHEVDMGFLLHLANDGDELEDDEPAQD